MKKMNGISERIKDYRLKLHLSQEFVANYLNVNRASFSQIELGNRKVTADEVAKLGILFGVSSDTLIYGEKIEAPTVAFARSFEQLDEHDQNEIISLMRFKEMMKSSKSK